MIEIKPIKIIFLYSYCTLCLRELMARRSRIILYSLILYWKIIESVSSVWGIQKPTECTDCKQRCSQYTTTNTTIEVTNCKLPPRECLLFSPLSIHLSPSLTAAVVHWSSSSAVVMVLALASIHHSIGFYTS